MNNKQIQEVISVLTDPVVRKMYQDNPRVAYETLQSRGHNLPDLGDDKELKVIVNTHEKMYIVFPEISSTHVLDNSTLGQIQAAGGVSTILVHGQYLYSGYGYGYHHNVTS